VTAFLQALLPALAGLLMLWAGLAALAGADQGELGARALARDPSVDELPPEQVLHVIRGAVAGLASLHIDDGAKAA